MPYGVRKNDRPCGADNDDKNIFVMGEWHRDVQRRYKYLVSDGGVRIVRVTSEAGLRNETRAGTECRR